MIKPAYSVSFLLSINIFVWQNVLYFLDAPRMNLSERNVWRRRMKEKEHKVIEGVKAARKTKEWKKFKEETKFQKT